MEVTLFMYGRDIERLTDFEDLYPLCLHKEISMCPSHPEH